jgi:hypothetical protein
MLKLPSQITSHFQRLPPLFILLLCLAAGPVYGGTCSNPTGNEADFIYNSNFHTYQFCNGTNWIVGGGTQSPDTIAAANTFGETNAVGTGGDGGNANSLLTQSATLSQAGTLQSLSFYVRNAAGHLRLGVYDATGTGGEAGNLLAQTNGFTPINGWNTVNVITPVGLAAGNYWLAYLTDSNSLGFTVNSNSGQEYGYGYTYGTMPATFTYQAGGSNAVHWSFYGTVTSGGSTLGDTTIEAGNDNGNANTLLAYQATLAQGGTAQSMSFYASNAAGGNLRMGIYDATGPGGGPGAKLAETNSIVLTTGWNGANLITPVALSAGTYWLAHLPDNSGTNYPAERTTGSCKGYSFTFGTMPATFSTTPNDCTPTNWTYYVTFASSYGVVAPGCVVPAGKERDIIYNSGSHTYQFCNGGNWIPFGGNVPSGGGGGGCSSPAGHERDIIYNSGSHTYQFCNGTNWVKYGGKVWQTTLGGTAGGGAGTGYFVMSQTTWNGNLGGLAGADAKCLTELTTNTGWKGYADANSRGILTSGKVHAFLCDWVDGCNNLAANTTYYLADANNGAHGGNRFTTDGSGNGPYDAADWSSASNFGAFYTYWTNRGLVAGNAWPPTAYATGQDCGSDDKWDNATNSYNGAFAYSGPSESAINWPQTRWFGYDGNGYGTTTCDQTEHLICYVNP